MLKSSGNARGASWGDKHTAPCSNQISIVVQGGLEVCDNAHSLGVMKKVKDTQSSDGHGDFQLRRRDQPHCHCRGAVAENCLSGGTSGPVSTTNQVDDLRMDVATCWGCCTGWI